MAALELAHVSKVYDDGTEAVSDLELEIVGGGFMVFVGPAGRAAARRASCAWSRDSRRSRQAKCGSVGGS